MLPGDHQPGLPHKLFSKGGAKSIGFGTPARDHTDNAACQDAEAQGDHDDGEDRLAEERPNHNPVEEGAQDTHQQDAAQESNPVGQLERGDQAESDEGPEHHEIALGKIEDLCGLINEDKTEGHEPINATDGDAADNVLNVLG